VSFVRWRESQRVKAVIFLALTLLPVLIAVGFVIDRARLLGADQAPYHGIDTAVLAATAAQPVGQLELVFVIDASDSMGGWKIEVVQSASKRLVDQLIAARGQDQVRVGLVPYATALNAGQYADRVLGRSQQTDRDEAWAGADCVMERDGIAAMTDDAPAPGAFYAALPRPLGRWIWDARANLFYRWQGTRRRFMRRWTRSCQRGDCRTSWRVLGLVHSVTKMDVDLAGHGGGL